MVSLGHSIWGMIFLFISCAKLQYVFDQGIGQISLLNRAIPNEKVLQTVEVKREDKEKILNIIKYKKFFYQFFSMKEKNIYSKTTFLQQDAVIYLVVASPYDQIKAKEFHFPILGKFPYLGLFDQKKAENFAKKLELEEDLVTFVRPVYAYSTLGHFEDTILSSFFIFNETDLAELIFHELFHTIFFLKDEVEFNENLANYFARELVYIYFNMNEEEKKKLELLDYSERELSKKMVELIDQLNQELLIKKPQKREEGIDIFNNFMVQVFTKEIQKKCDDLKLKKTHCFPLLKDWNHASFSQFLTYESSYDKIHQMRLKHSTNLVDFLSFLQKQEKEYQSNKDSRQFLEFISSLKD